ncbi:hypothetical protein [Sphingobium sp.]|uniref:hypothetical protein n=1 Tax=Sphingobium sp. TaxID=1912891 RepID=UPI003B3AD593
MNDKSDIYPKDYNDHGGKAKLLISNIDSIIEWLENVENDISDNNVAGTKKPINFSIRDEILSIKKGIEYFLVQLENMRNSNDSTISLLSMVNKETIVAHAQVEKLRPLADRADVAEGQLREKMQEASNLELQLSEQKENAERVADEARALQGQLEGQIEASRSVLRQKDDAIALIQAELQDQQSRTDRLTAEAETLRAELKEQSGFADNRLRQKEEEIVQAQAALDRQLTIADGLTSEAETLREKLDEANKWVFNLAGQRRDLELTIKGHQNRSVQAANLVASSQNKISRLEARLLQEKLDLENQKYEVKRLQNLCEELKNSINVKDLKSQNPISPLDEYKRTIAIRNANDKFGIANYEKTKLASLASDLHHNVEFLTRRLIEMDEEASRYRNLYRKMKEDVSFVSQNLRSGKPLSKEFSSDTQDLVFIVDEIERENILKEKIKDEHTEKMKDIHENLGKIFGVISKEKPRWWYIMPKKWRDNKNYEEMKRCGFFDRDLYYSIHPDVESSQMDALDHYIRHGIDEGRTWSA